MRLLSLRWLPLAAVLLVLHAPTHAQVVIRHHVEVTPERIAAPMATASAASGYPTDDGIFYSVRGRLSDGFTTCCTDAGPCQIPFLAADAVTVAGTGYAGGVLADTLGVLGHLVPGTPFENPGYYPLGYPGYQNCQTSHLRGFTTFTGGDWVDLGDVEDGLTLRSTFGHESWDTWASGEVQGDAYNYFDRELYGIPFNTFSKPQSHNYPLCGHGPHKGAEVDLFFEARYKAVRFRVTVEPAQIAPGEVATVTVTPVDSAGVPVGMPIRDNVAVSAYDATGAGLTGRGAGVVPLSNPSLPPATGRYWSWPNYVSREGQVFGVIAPPDSLAPTAPETVTVRAWGYSGTRNRHVVGEAELTLCPVGGCETGGMEVTVSPAVLQPGEEGVVSVEVTAAVADLTDDDEVDLDLGEDTAQMGGLVLDGSEADPAPSLRARLGDIRAGLVRYRVLGWDELGRRRGLRRRVPGVRGEGECPNGGCDERPRARSHA